MCKNIITPKLMVAIMAAASFSFIPALVQAGEKGQNKKAEMMMKKDVQKAGHKAHESKSGGAKPFSYDLKSNKKAECTASKKDKNKAGKNIEVAEGSCGGDMTKRGGSKIIVKEIQKRK